MLPGAVKKMRARGGRWTDLWQRLGFLPRATRETLARWRETDAQVLWIHAVSVGEVGIATKLVRELYLRQPECRVVLTTTTPTGMALVRKLGEEFPGALLPLYSALDGWFVVRRFLRAITPRQLVLVEAEVWPNLVCAASRRKIPVRLVNARLSPRSEKRYLKLRALVQPVFSLLTEVMVQEPEDVARWQALGLEPGRVVWTGSIKFDEAGDRQPVEQIAAFRALLEGEGVKPTRPVLLAASTHAGEEEELTRVYLKLRAAHPSLFLILVPRHVERAPDIQRRLGTMEMKVRLRSHIEREHAASPDCLLVDTTGELKAWQGVATMVVIGKSFLATGGQNPAEAVMLGKPVLFGPHMENFSALVQVLLARGGAIRVTDFAGLQEQVDRLLRHPEEAAAVAQAGHAALRTHEGATGRTAARLLT